MESLGIRCEFHHHEVSSGGQGESGGGLSLRSRVLGVISVRQREASYCVTVGKYSQRALSTRSRSPPIKP
jgi:hypothetical protein